MPLIDNLAQSIATMEGYFKPGTIAAKNNNPGNLRSWGSNPTQNGYAIFPTPEAGWTALQRQIEINIGRGLTLNEFFGGKPGVYPGYAPSADSNNPSHYAQFVAGRAGIPADRPITAFLNNDYPDSEPAPYIPGFTPDGPTEDDSVFDIDMESGTGLVIIAGLLAAGIWLGWKA